MVRLVPAPEHDYSPTKERMQNERKYEPTRWRGGVRMNMPEPALFDCVARLSRQRECEQGMDAADARGILIRHLEDALTLADGLNDGTTAI